MKHLRWCVVGAALAASLAGCGMQQAGGESGTTAPSASVASDGVFNIVDYGAIGDGKTMSTQAIQKAINACAAAGGGKVLIPAGTYLTGPIVLKSHVDLHTSSGALVQFSANRDDYPMALDDFEGKLTAICQSPISGKDLEGAAITGEGIFDGNGQVWRPSAKSKMPPEDWDTLVKSGGAVEKTKDDTTGKKEKIWWPSQAALDGHDKLTELRRSTAPANLADYAPLRDLLRPPLVMFSRCHNLTLEGVTFRNSPSWTIHLLLCSNVIVRNMTSYNPSYGRNTDGIDFDSCNTVLMTGCTVNSGDDDICIKSGRDEEGRKRGKACENITIDNCVIGWGHGGVAIGSEMSGGVRNVTVSNCIMTGCNVGLRFKSRRGRGGVVENITMSNVVMYDMKNAAIGVDLFYVDRAYKDVTSGPMPVTDATPIFRQISMHNIVCTSGKQAIDIHGLPEMPLSDVTLDHVNLTCDTGAVIENAHNIVLRDVEIHSTAAPPLVMHNVSGFSMSDVTATATDPLPKPATRPSTKPSKENKNNQDSSEMNAPSVNPPLNQ